MCVSVVYFVVYGGVLCGRVVYCVVGQGTVCYGGALCVRVVFCVLG